MAKRHDIEQQLGLAGKYTSGFSDANALPLADAMARLSQRLEVEKVVFDAADTDGGEDRREILGQSTPALLDRVVEAMVIGKDVRALVSSDRTGRWFQGSSMTGVVQNKVKDGDFPSIAADLARNIGIDYAKGERVSLPEPRGVRVVEELFDTVTGRSEAARGLTVVRYPIVDVPGCPKYDLLNVSSETGRFAGQRGIVLAKRPRPVRSSS